MNPWIEICVYTTLAGGCIPAGGMLASFEHIRPTWLETEVRHFVIAFGGGVLVAAVALVLIPEGTAHLPRPVDALVWFVAGGALFFLLERSLGQAGRQPAPQFLAMLLDFAPESLALGGMFALDSRGAVPLALFIGLQNLPEGFNAYRELRRGKHFSRRRVLTLMMLLVPLGPSLAVAGRLWLPQHTYLLGALMLFASGGILYLIFQDIAPQSRLQRHWAPPLGAVLGFSLALFGQGVLASP